MEQTVKKWIIPQHRNSQVLRQTNRNNINDEQSYFSSFMDDYARGNIKLDYVSEEKKEIKLESKPEQVPVKKTEFDTTGKLDVKPKPKKPAFMEGVKPNTHLTPLDDEQNSYFHIIPYRLLLQCNRGHLIPKKQKGTQVTECLACATIDFADQQGHKIMLMPDSVQVGIQQPIRWKCLDCFEIFYTTLNAINEYSNSVRNKAIKRQNKERLDEEIRIRKEERLKSQPEKRKTAKPEEHKPEARVIERKYHCCATCAAEPCSFKPTSTVIIKNVFELLTGCIPVYNVNFEHSPTAYHPLCPLVLLNEADLVGSKIDIGGQTEIACNKLHKRLVRMRFRPAECREVCEYLMDQVPYWADLCEIPTEVVKFVLSYINNIHKTELNRIERKILTKANKQQKDLARIQEKQEKQEAHKLREKLRAQAKQENQEKQEKQEL